MLQQRLHLPLLELRHLHWLMSLDSHTYLLLDHVKIFGVVWNSRLLGNDWVKITNANVSAAPSRNLLPITLRTTFLMF